MVWEEKEAEEESDLEEVKVCDWEVQEETMGRKFEVGRVVRTFDLAEKQVYHCPLAEVVVELQEEAEVHHREKAVDRVHSPSSPIYSPNPNEVAEV